MNTTGTFLALIAVVLILTIYLGRVQKTRDERILRQKLMKSFAAKKVRKISSEKMEAISEYYRHHQEDGRFHVDDITWNDLNMDRIFAEMDTACSASGEEYLYYLLRSPALCESEQLISPKILKEISEHEKERLDLQIILSTLGTKEKYSIYSYLDHLDKLGARHSGRHLLALLLPIAGICITFADVRIGVIWFLLSLGLNVVTYFREKSEIDPYLSVFRYVLRLLNAASALEKCNSGEIFREEIDEIKNNVSAFSSFRAGSFLLISESGSSGSPIDIVLDYLRILFHLDLLRFDTMLKQLRGHNAELDRLCTLIGKIDAAICIASWRESLPAYCVPAITEKKSPFFSSKDMIHPLLEAPVPASITTDAGVLLTGSNASGKSTFLRSTALCALLAQTISTAPAKEYTGCFFRIYSSMSLSDSLQKGESYFMAEIRSLKRITDAASNSTAEPVLCFIDEVLRGTNTVERIAASAEILLSFTKMNVLCFAATHDIELTNLLDGKYSNYHFEEQIEDSDVKFKYQLLPGKAVTRNAIRLLSAIGYDKEIILRAERRADTFTQIGKWTDLEDKDSQKQPKENE